jgi:pseudouridine-5'-phosphate glycosidase
VEFIEVSMIGNSQNIDAQETFDISADLIELGMTPVAVVCAGIKTILDIPKTLELLETLGVAVVGIKTSSFPEFFFSEGSSKVSARVGKLYPIK